MFVKNLTDITLQVNKYNKTLILKPGVNCVGAEWNAEDIKVVYGPKYVAFITGDEEAPKAEKEEVKEAPAKEVEVKEEKKEDAPKAEKEEKQVEKKEAPKAKAKAKK